MLFIWLNFPDLTAVHCTRKLFTQEIITTTCMLLDLPARVLILFTGNGLLLASRSDLLALRPLSLRPRVPLHALLLALFPEIPGILC